DAAALHHTNRVNHPDETAPVASKLGPVISSQVERGLKGSSRALSAARVNADLGFRFGSQTTHRGSLLTSDREGDLRCYRMAGRSSSKCTFVLVSTSYYLPLPVSRSRMSILL